MQLGHEMTSEREAKGWARRLNSTHSWSLTKWGWWSPVGTRSDYPARIIWRYRWLLLPSYLSDADDKSFMSVTSVGLGLELIVHRLGDCFQLGWSSPRQWQVQDERCTNGRVSMRCSGCCSRATTPMVFSMGWKLKISKSIGLFSS